MADKVGLFDLRTMLTGRDPLYSIWSLAELRKTKFGNNDGLTQTNQPTRFILHKRPR